MYCSLCCLDTVYNYFTKTEKNGDIKNFFKCETCGLVFLDPADHLSPEEERSIYDFHQNSPENEGYVGFLKRLANPLMLKLKENSKGLDFGCGPGPTLSTIFKANGYEIFNYDPYYFPDSTLLNNKYDFITCTEVIEHFYQPGKEFLFFDTLLKENKSFLGIMTQLLPEGSNFDTWWYHRDPTHVSIYSLKTFTWISEWMGWKMEIPENGVVIYSK